MEKQVRQLESRLSTAQLALKQAHARTPSKSQQFTASLSPVDAMSPSQTLQASHSTQGWHKKARAESTQPIASQTLASQDTAAIDSEVTTSSLPAAQHSTHDAQPGDFACLSMHMCALADRPPALLPFSLCMKCIPLTWSIVSYTADGVDCL